MSGEPDEYLHQGQTDMLRWREHAVKQGHRRLRRPLYPGGVSDLEIYVRSHITLKSLSFSISFELNITEYLVGRRYKRTRITVTTCQNLI